MIRAREVSIIRAGRSLVDHVNLDLKPGCFTIVLGPNGAGKSTLLKTMAGELSADRGQILYDDLDVRKCSAADLAQRRAVLPQSMALAFPFTALEVVRMGAIAYGSLKPTEDARRALARVDLKGFEGRAYQALSGGEQQRVQFARVLAQVPEPVDGGRPKALFLDEPTASLDLGHQISVLEIARDFVARGGAAMAILHDLNLACEFADHLVVMHRGRVVSEGTPAETITDEVISSVYGIRGAVGRVPQSPMPYVLPQARI
jgi:ABC-type hemin transport system, ATPase component